MHGAVYVLAEITFLFYLRVILIWTDDTYFLFVEFLLFIFDSGASEVPLFYSFSILFFFIDLLSWTEFQHADDPCLGYFWKKFSIFQAQRGCNGILLMFQDKQTWSYIILNYDCLFFREINSRNRFQRFPILVIIIFNRPIFCLDCPLRVFNLTDFYFFFFWSLFF